MIVQKVVLAVHKSNFSLLPESEAKRGDLDVLYRDFSPGSENCNFENSEQKTAVRDCALYHTE